MSVYQPAIILTDDRTVVSLRHIESMHFTRNEEDRIIDKLKADATIKIRTTSGLESVISMRQQKDILGQSYQMSDDMDTLREDVFQRWISLIS